MRRARTQRLGWKDGKECPSQAGSERPEGRVQDGESALPQSRWSKGERLQVPEPLQAIPLDVEGEKL